MPEPNFRVGAFNFSTFALQFYCFLKNHEFLEYHKFILKCKYKATDELSDSKYYIIENILVFIMRKNMETIEKWDTS